MGLREIALNSCITDEPWQYTHCVGRGYIAERATARVGNLDHGGLHRFGEAKVDRGGMSEYTMMVAKTRDMRLETTIPQR